MGQFAILDLLKRYPDKWFSVSEIAYRLNIENSSVSLNCRQLRKHEVVEYKTEKQSYRAGQLIYKHKVNNNEVRRNGTNTKPKVRRRRRKNVVSFIKRRD